MLAGAALALELTCTYTHGATATGGGGGGARPGHARAPEAGQQRFQSIDSLKNCGSAEEIIITGMSKWVLGYTMAGKGFS